MDLDNKIMEEYRKFILDRTGSEPNESQIEYFKVGIRLVKSYIKNGLSVEESVRKYFNDMNR